MYRTSTGIINLKDKICLVTGGSKGIGKGIATELAYYGATCYVTGRNLDALEAVIREVEEKGGSGKVIPVQCDHSDDDQVRRVFDRINEENEGKLDLLVNNVYTAVGFIFENTGKKFWELPEESWDVVNNVGLRNQYKCAVHASKMMIEKRQGLIINISSIGGLRYLFNVPYGIGKCAKDRMAQDCALELKKFKVAFISLWPGLVKTEKIGAIVETQQKKNEINNSFSRIYDKAESPTFVGRTVAALLAEPHEEVMQRTGNIVLTTEVARKHSIRDEKGLMPQDMFQLNVILRSTGYSRLANFIPDFIRFPLWVSRMAEAYKHC